MARRIIVFIVDDTTAAEAFIQAVDLARQPGWKPNPPGVPFGSPQERYTEEEVGPWILERLREAAPKVHLGPSGLIPKESA